jgi:hypothetical protein
VADGTLRSEHLPQPCLRANKLLELDVVQPSDGNLDRGAGFVTFESGRKCAASYCEGRKQALGPPNRSQCTEVSAAESCTRTPLPGTISMASLIGLKGTPHPWAPIANCFLVQGSKAVGFQCTLPRVA